MAHKLYKVKILILLSIWGSIFLIGFIFLLLSNHLINVRNHYRLDQNNIFYL